MAEVEYLTGKQVHLLWHLVLNEIELFDDYTTSDHPFESIDDMLKYYKDLVKLERMLR